MGKDTKVEWCDHSWGPWRGGCDPRGPECTNCYARRDMKRYGHDPDVLVRSKTTFNDPLKWKEPARIFVCSWSDFFLQDADPLRADAWDVMRRAAQHTYIIPTKRPELIMDRLPDDWDDGWPNVWLLVSAGTQESFDKWWPILRDVPAAVRGISIEPLLDSTMNIDDYFVKVTQVGYGPDNWASDYQDVEEKPDWVVIGGESASLKDARRFPIDMAEEIVDLCDFTDTPVFVKQMGTRWARETSIQVDATPYQLGDRKGSKMEWWPEHLMVRQWPM